VKTFTGQTTKGIWLSMEIISEMPIVRQQRTITQYRDKVHNRSRIR
jgi:hypothetical protein